MRCEKQKDAEPADEQVFEMTEVALIEGSSIVLTRVDGSEVPKKRKSAGLTANQQMALDALQNVIIETGNQAVSSSLWHEARRVKCPDLARQRAGEARHQLMEKKIVASDGGRVWIINENN